MFKNVKKRNFVLIELMISIIVIGILVGMALPKFIGSQKDAKVAALQKDLDTIENAMIIYNANANEKENKYPLGEKINITDLNSNLKEQLKNMKDDCTEIYKIDSNKLKSYISKLKYDIDDYYYSTKSNCAIFPEGKEDSKNNTHYLLNNKIVFDNISGVSIKEFGAVGDGITDDTNAIQKAFNSSNNILEIPEGTYLISKSLSIPSNKTIIGNGEKSIIKLIGNSGKVDMLKSKDSKNITLKNFQIDGNKDSYNDKSALTTDLYFDNCNNINLDKMFVTGSLIEGVYFYKSSNINITNLYTYKNGFHQQDASGLHLDTCEKANVEDSLLVNNGFHGLILSSTNKSNISNIITQNNGWDGVRVQYESNNNNFKNIDSSNNTRGIYFTTNSNKNNIISSAFNNNEFNGITLNESKENVLDEVTSMNNKEYGLYLENDTDNIINKKILFLNNELGSIYSKNESQIIK